MAQSTRQRGCLGPDVRKFSRLLYTYIFFKAPNKKFLNRAKELYCDTTIFVFWFSIVYLPKKNGNWKMAQGCWRSPNSFFVNEHTCKKKKSIWQPTWDISEPRLTWHVKKIFITSHESVTRFDTFFLLLESYIYIIYYSELKEQRYIHIGYDNTRLKDLICNRPLMLVRGGISM